MKLAFLTPEYPHPAVNHSGGLGTSIKNLIETLVGKGVEITIFIYGQPYDKIIKENGITIHLIADQKYRFAKWFWYRKYINKYINKYILEENIQAIEVPDWTGISAFMKFQVPCVMRFHGSDTYFCHLEQRKQKWKNNWFENKAVKDANAYIAPTAFAGKLSAKLFKLKTEQVKIIHYGLPLKSFENTNPNEFTEGLIVYIGTLIRKKGVLELPHIFEKVKQKCPNAKLVLIGAEAIDVKTKIPTWHLIQEKLSPSTKEDVKYLGKIPYSEVQAAIQKANVCVFPTYAETLGMVTIEAMAMQKAVVNSSIGWAQELMEDGKSGFLVHPSNHEAFAEKICQCIKNPDLVKQIGVEANKFVASKFDSELIAEQNIQFYKALIS